MPENKLPMSGIKNFMIGFCLSLSSVMLIGRLSSPVTLEAKKLPSQNIKIDLFKTANASVIPQAQPALFAEIKKESFINDDFTKTAVNVSPEGAEDDEILSVNIDGTIPIEYAASDFSYAQVLYESEDDESAMLPADEIISENDINESSPWVIAKGSKHIKNKKLLEQFGDEAKPSALTDGFKQAAKEDEAYSYKVAERIKQSIIFPIPDEILNDENLTPTFIKQPSKAAPSSSKVSKKASSATDEIKIISKETPVEIPQSAQKDTSILNSISSWFSDTPTTDIPSPQKKKKAAPTYGRTNALQKDKEATHPEPAAEDLADFYETLQETKAEYAKKVIPSELKMSFQPERAEISGSTLKWLKVLSEATKASNTSLEVRLDASAAPELQKKRLSLLYSIFTNNGVDFSKINTIFSSTAPNAFIIKVIKSR